MPEDIKNIKLSIQLADLKLNYAKQETLLYSKFTRTERVNAMPKFEVQELTLRGKAQTCLVPNIEITPLQAMNFTKIKKDGREYNLDVSLSCIGSARILGLKNAASTCYLQKKAEEAGLIDVDRRIILVTKEERRMKWNTKHLQLKSKSFFYTKEWEKMGIYYRLPNLINFNF